MKTVEILDKKFELFIPYEKIRSKIETMADEMNKELVGKNPLFICVLNGAFMFATELYKRIESLDSEISFVKLASYIGTDTTGKIKQLIGLNENIEGRTVVIIEDIVDTGITMKNMLGQLEGFKPKEVLIASLLVKPGKLQEDIDVEYVGFEIPNDFIVGFGLDYDGCGRNLLDIYSVVE